MSQIVLDAIIARRTYRTMLAYQVTAKEKANECLTRYLDPEIASILLQDMNLIMKWDQLTLIDGVPIIDIGQVITRYELQHHQTGAEGEGGEPSDLGYVSVQDDDNILPSFPNSDNDEIIETYSANELNVKKSKHVTPAMAAMIAAQSATGIYAIYRLVKFGRKFLDARKAKILSSSSSSLSTIPVSSPP
jgi:hypothetical protein